MDDEPVEEDEWGDVGRARRGTMPLTTRKDRNAREVGGGVDGGLKSGLESLPPEGRVPTRKDWRAGSSHHDVGIRARMVRATERWRTLLDAPRELWIIYAMKFLSSYSYFSFALVLTLFLTEEYGMSDQAAGWVYGMYGVMSTISGVVCGWIIDSMGVRWSLAVGALVGTVTRLFLAFTGSKTLTVSLLYTALPLSESLGIPIMTIGIKRYTNASNRTYAFSFFYSVMNLAALVAGPLVDLLRRVFKGGLTVGGDSYSALRLVLITSALATFVMLAVVCFGIREIEVDENGNVTSFEPNQADPWEQTRRVLREPAFWRLALFTLLLVGVRLVFRHMDATLPKYMTREFGEDAPFGLIYAINPFLIIFLVPVVGLMTKGVDSFSMILYGSFISGVSPFWVCIGNFYWAIILFMVTLSVGEAVYSPRVYEYSMEISGKGEEGLYTSLSSAPLFTVKLIVGGMSGWLLTRFCPETGPRNSRAMWAIIGATSFVSPILMLLLRDVIEPRKSNWTAIENGRTVSSSLDTPQAITKESLDIPVDSDLQSTNLGTHSLEVK
uniref:Major facilitator superfamily (MFS) profile domain-containing protein n=1 Tax=Compsopogon caeruleus TaxID=31354 RepID=A0A7S1THG9_9RHOD